VLEIGARERLVVLAPHPDDETLGAGGLIQRVVRRGGSARVIVLTAGDGYVEAVVHATGDLTPRPSAYVRYGEERLREARAALRQLGPPELLRLQPLGFPDGGLEWLLGAHWWRPDVARSPTTGASHPPYPEAVDRTIAYDGDDLRRELLNLLRDAQPTIVALPDPLDRHPDHRATSVFGLLAVRDFTAGGGRLPRLLAYLVHWPDWPPDWGAPTPPGDAAERDLRLPATLPPRDTPALVLTAREIAGKQGALARYASQQAVMSGFLAAFVRRTEPFTALGETDVRRAGDLVPPPRGRQSQ
jgi:LmbE family N-acetylglucosaminyl deacetylase